MKFKISKVAQGCILAFSASSVPSIALAESPWKVTNGTRVEVTSGYASTTSGDYPLYAEGSGSILETAETGLSFSTTGDSVYAAWIRNGGEIILNDVVLSTEGNQAHAVNVYKGRFSIENGTIDVNGESSAAIYGGKASDLNVNKTNIVATGTSTSGIKLTDGTLNMADSTITASGDGSQGIVLAYSTVGKATAVLDNVSVYLLGDGSQAGIMLGNGSVVGQNVTLSSTDKNRGVDIYNPGSDRGSLTLTDSSITTQKGDGIYILNGDVTLTDTNITTSSGRGINANKGATVTLYGGSITTHENSAEGVWIATENSSLTADGTSFTTNGNNAIAINAQYGYANLKNNVIKTAGDLSYGLYSEYRVDAENLSIETSGQMAIGIFAALGGEITVEGGSLSTTGDNSAGILSYPDSLVEANAISLSTQGNNSPALWAVDGDISLSNSQVTTSGINAFGLLVTDGGTANESTVTLDNVSLSTQQSSAIRTNGAALNIALRNGTQVSAGNGVLLEDFANPGSPKDVTLTAENNVVLEGDIRAATENNVNIALSQASVLTGAINGTDQLSIDDSSAWLLTGSSSVGTFAHNGVTEFQHSGNDFYTLTLDSLSGNGSFSMNTDVASLTGDQIIVNGQASGDHSIAISNTGKEPGKTSDVLTLVDTQGGDASFTLKNDVVDVGTYQYELQHQGDDWVLAQKDQAEPDVPDVPDDDIPDPVDPDDDVPDDNVPDVPDVPDADIPVLTPTAETAIGMFNALPTAWYGEMTTLRLRMGEVRGTQQQGDVWLRMLGNQYNVTATQDIGYEQEQAGFSIGVDTVSEMEYGQLITGLFTGYSNSDLDFDNDSTGSIDSYFIGSYGTFLFHSGWYIDAVAKANNFSSTADARMSDGTQSEGSYSTPGFGLSLEVGRQFTFDNGWFAEPSAQISALWVKGETYEYDNGLEAKSEQMSSKQIALNGVVGKSITLDSGITLQPWIRAAVINELVDQNDVSINGNNFTNDMSGLRGEYGAGMSVQVTHDFHVYADARYGKGDNIESPWAGNLGVRWRW